MFKHRGASFESAFANLNLVALDAEHGLPKSGVDEITNTLSCFSIVKGVCICEIGESDWTESERTGCSFAKSLPKLVRVAQIEFLFGLNHESLLLLAFFLLRVNLLSLGGFLGALLFRGSRSLSLSTLLLRAHHNQLGLLDALLILLV